MFGSIRDCAQLTVRGFTLLGLGVLAACGDGNESGTATPWPPPSSASWRSGVFAPASQFANKCVNTNGTDTETGQPYGSGTILDQNNFLRSWTNDLYLWYSEVPDADPATYPDTLAYFDVLKTSAVTASANPKDRFHFTYPTPDWLALSQSGVAAGYGAQWVIIGTAPNRRVVVAYTEFDSPAGDAVIERGAEVISVDGVSIATGNTQAEIDVLNEGLFPSDPGGSHEFVIQDLGAPSTRTVTLTAENVTSDPVPSVGTVTSGSSTVGYILFNDHIATSEAALIDAADDLVASGIDELVLDIRYNGGGYLAIASELAYMIAGSARTSGQTFEQLQFNDKHPTNDPVTGDPLAPMPFLSTANIDPSIQGQNLPQLNLSRVFVLTGVDTCSASESIINSLRGVGVQVIQIGSRTCGKPYGFYPEDNCGTTYFSIQFRGVNAQNFGDYADGFVPTQTPSADLSQVPGCPVADDFTHELGDANEARFAAALQYLSAGTCPAASSAATAGLGKPSLSGVEGRVYKSPLLTNRILQR